METYGGGNPERYEVQDKKLLDQTDSYPMADVSLVVVPTRQVPDIATGGKRKRRFGFVISGGGVPNMDETEDPLTLNTSMPKILLDGDNLDILRERAHAELDTMFNVFEDIMNGAGADGQKQD